MKVFIVFVLFACFTFPAFSQATNAQRFRALGDAMATTLTRSNAALADFDSRANDDGSVRRYVNFLGQYNALARALSESDRRLNFLLTANAHRNDIAEEHTNFEELLRRMEALKNEYDSWLRTVQ